MSLQEFTRSTIHSQQEAMALMRQTLELADADKVYSQPLQGEGFQVLTATEIAGGMGFGFGAGRDVEEAALAEAPVDPDCPDGAGGGGGAGSYARPVAVISLTEGAVRVEPIIDHTAVLKTFFIALGVGLLAFARRR